MLQYIHHLQQTHHTASVKDQQISTREHCDTAQKTYLSLHCPLLLFFYTAVGVFGNELSVYKLRHKNVG